jgi:hypothetical protein
MDDDGLGKPLLGPENFSTEDIDLVTAQILLQGSPSEHSVKNVVHSNGV